MTERVRDDERVIAGLYFREHPCVEDRLPGVFYAVRGSEQKGPYPSVMEALADWDDQA